MKTSKTVTLLGVVMTLLFIAPTVLMAQTADDKLRFVGSTQWDCDDRIAFHGADGGLHDTVSLLRVSFDADLREFTGIFRNSLSYGAGLYTQEYKISGYAFDENGQVGIFIDHYKLTERPTLPDDIDWRDMARGIYY
ncbi:hypothetical protein, partial [Staphylococcus aureus]|uniref:hypothetical protein n=1 Tax=Staphylococcus aureus TaxID=1280 RepID=UPI001154FB91